MKLLKYSSYVLPLFLLIPMVAGAQSLGYFTTGFADINNLIRSFLIPLLLSLALLLFIWGVIQYFILGAGDEGKRETGRSYMLYAIIGLVAIVAVWGIVNLLISILGITNTNIPGGGSAPAIPTAS
jgi:hypothetical protein